MTPTDLRRWGRHAAASPLYTHLVEVIASDEGLMSILNRIEHTPKPNLLLGGVNFLLARFPDHELAAHYPNHTGDPAPIHLVDAPFRDFVATFEEPIVEIGRRRYTQTNECRRCVALLPGIWAAPFDRFHLIDIGTSAGLNLAFDRYEYAWDSLVWGGPSTVVLATASKGVDPEPRQVEVLSRTGLDLNPIDTDDPDELAWLEALIWPEQHQRRERLMAAWDVARSLPMEMIAGDAIDTLPAALEQLPAAEPAVVINSHALNQVSPEGRRALADVVAAGRSHRPIHRVSLEILGDEDWASIEVDTGDGWRVIGNAHHHGDWVELYALP
jgi:hypothetical protein